MATLSLKAAPREGSGKSIARKIRASGLIPAVVYRGGNDPAHLSIDPAELEVGFKRTGNRNTLVDIELGEGGPRRLCLVKAVQRHPVNLNILHVDFFEVSPEEEVRVLVPISTKGRAAGVIAGGKLQVMVRDLPLTCKPGDIPPSVVVDVTDLEIGKYIRASEIPDPEGCRLENLRDFNVVTCMARRGLKAADEVEEVS